MQSNVGVQERKKIHTNSSGQVGLHKGRVGKFAIGEEICKATETVKDREACSAAVHGVTKNQA